mgnify:CR=1 FL=1
MSLTVPGVIVHPLSIEDVVHGDHIVVLGHGTTANATKLLHVSADAEEEA